MQTHKIIFSLCSAITLTGVGIVDANAALIRITCETGSDYSKVSVDGRGLVAGASYTARIKSETFKRKSAAQETDINGENEFDFSSKTNDINAGATAISSNFIQGDPPTVTGKIVDPDGFAVATDSVACTVK